VDSRASETVSATDIRACQSMLRKVYALRVDAYNARDVRRRHVGIVEGWKVQATAGLGEIKGIVKMWADRGDLKWSPEERARVNAIRERILAIQPDLGVPVAATSIGGPLR
jgi:hypothetical protein